MAGRPGAQDAAHVIVGRTLVIDAATGELVRALRHVGLRCILLKGPAFARWLYDDGAPRDYLDIDLLLAPSDLGTAEGVLSRAGFERVAAEVALPHGRLIHADTWIREGDGLVIDLHRNLPGVQVAPEVAWSVLSAATEPMVVGTEEVEVLPEPARALLVALHASHHGRDSSRALTDLVRAVARLSDRTWSEAARLAARLEATEPFAAGLRLLPDGRHVADRLGLPIATSVETILRAGSAPELALSLDWLSRAPGPRVKGRLILRKLIPRPSVMRGRSRLARRGTLGLAAAYLAQPLWLTWHAAPALRAWLFARRESRRLPPTEQR